MDVKHVISFSGGKDSTAMLLMMIEKGYKIDGIVFIDTTKEFPEMYEHIKKIEQFIFPLGITKFSFDFDYWMFSHKKTRGNNKGTYGYGWPFFSTRWCTALKRRMAQKIFPKDKKIWYHGIAYDERERVNKNKNDIKYPLVEWGVTEQSALEYCYEKGFSWNGLYRKFTRVSCWCCPFSRIDELRGLYLEFPDLWQKLIKMDSKAYNDFRADYTVQKLDCKFKKELPLWA